MPSFTDALFGKKGGFEQYQTMTPQQQNLFSQLFSGLGGQGGQGGMGQGMDLISQLMGGNQQFLEQMQAPALRQFQEQIIPGIAEMFAGKDAQRSSAFTQALGGAGAGLAERLAGQRAGMGMQSQQMGLQGLLSMLGFAQTPQFGTAYRQPTEGALGGILGGIGGGLGMGMGGGMGSLFSGLGGLFKRGG